MRAWYRRAAAQLLACALLLGHAPAALAAGAPPAGYSGGASAGPVLGLPPWFPGAPGPFPDPFSICGIRPDYTGQLILLAAGTVPKLPATVLGLTDEAKLVACPVEWDTGGLDAGKPGRFLVPGTLAAPQGYHFAAYLGKPVAAPPYPLFFYAQGIEPETLMDIDIPLLSRSGGRVYRLGVGMDVSTLPFWGAEAVCRTGQYEDFTLPVHWELGGFQADRPGRYVLRAAIDLPPGFSPPQGYAPFTVEVEVGDPQPLRLGPPRLENGNVVCAYASPIADFEEIRLECYEDRPDEKWRQFSTRLGEDGKMYGPHVAYDGSSLAVLPHGFRWDTQMEPGVGYSFRLRYQGTYSNVLHVRLPVDGGAPQYWLEGAGAGPPSPGPYEGPSGGDRGGGDRDAQELPPLRQPAPQKGRAGDAQPAPQDAAMPAAGPPPPPYEASTGTATVLSGARLAQLTELNPETVLVEKQGIAVELPAGYLRGLGLADWALLEITVEPAGENGFKIALAAAGEALAELPQTLVRLPLAAPPREGAPLACYDAGGGFVCDAAWLPALGVAAVKITRAGTYTVREKGQVPLEPAPAAVRAPPAAPGPPAPAAPGPPGTRLPPLALAALPAAGTCLWLALRRKKGRRNG